MSKIKQNHGEGPTVSASILQGFVNTALEMGMTKEEIESQTGLNFDTLSDPDGRIPISVSISLRGVLEKHFGPSFGLRIMEKMKSTKHSVIAYLFANSATLGESYKQLSRYRKIVAEISAPELKVDGNLAVFGCSYPDIFVLANPSMLEAFVGYWLIRGRYYTGVDWDPVEVHLQGNVTDKEDYQRIFRAPVINNSNQCALVFDKEILDLPILDPDQNLARYLKPIADEVLKNLPGNRSIIQQVQEQLLKTLEHGDSTLESIAQRLHMSARTLQRRLDDEGSKFGEILDETRRLAALEFMKNQRIAIAETAFLLGFSEPSTFHRAFKRWTGSTPASFRKQILAG